MNPTLLNTIMVSTAIWLWTITGVHKLAESYSDYRDKKEKKIIKEHTEKINTILGLNTIPDSYLNPLSNSECKILKGIPVLDELIRKWVNEITLKTNTSWISWDEEKWEIKGADYRSSSYKDREKNTFDKRHLAVSYRMKNTDTWQAFTQDQIKRIFLETSYAIFFPPKDGVCTYSSRTTEWKSADLIGISSSPSEELTNNLNKWIIHSIPRGAIWR